MEVDIPTENGKTAYLPTDILLAVMSYISSSPDSQVTLAACCLVSRQWYSAAIEYLYHTPQITGSNFNAFARSICPDFRSRSRRSDLGQLVRRFDMKMLVHESSNSLTTRLLGRMKDNLELYRAPMASFTESCLVPMSKSKFLRVLDLEIASPAMPLIKLKNAIKPLDRLTQLRMPKSILVPSDPKDVNAIPWPPNLKKFQFSSIDQVGPNKLVIPLEPRGRLSWPEDITSLNIKAAFRFPSWALYDMFNSGKLSETLRRVRLSSASWAESSISEIFLTPGPVLPNLTFLSVPGYNLTPELFMPLIGNEQTTPPCLNLEILEFGSSHFIFGDFPMEEFTQALNWGLPKLRRVGFHEVHAFRLSNEVDIKLDQLLEANALKAGYDPERIKSGDILTGVYYFGDSTR